MIRHLIFLPIILLGGLATIASTSQAAPQATPLADSVVRVNSTNQAYHFMEPWSKRRPYTRRGIGVIMKNHQVLVSSDLLTDYNYVEIEEPTTGKKSPATVKVVDYRAGLALLEPTKEGFLDSFKPADLNLYTQKGDAVQVMQLESNGTPVMTEGTVTAVQVAPYSKAGSSNLTYQVNAPLLPQDGSFTVPLFRSQELIGILLRYDRNNQSLDAIAAPVIKHFLEEAASEEYNGFGKTGIVMSSLRDPQLRQFVQLPENEDGVYITNVLTGSPADEAGIEQGDVLLAVNDVSIDRDGNYDHPLHGKIGILNYITNELHVGDTATFQLLRDGKPESVAVTVGKRTPDDEVIPSLSINEKPEYQMMGGLIFQPLTRRLLSEWGKNWRQRAPQQLVYYDQFQDDIFDEKQEDLVILTRVLRDESNIGYESLGMKVVTKVNDQTIHSFEDLQQAFESPVDGFHKIEFDDSPNAIYLDADTVKARDTAIRRTYGLPAED